LKNSKGLKLTRNHLDILVKKLPSQKNLEIIKDIVITIEIALKRDKDLKPTETQFDILFKEAIYNIDPKDKYEITHKLTSVIAMAVVNNRRLHKLLFGYIIYQPDDSLGLLVLYNLAYSYNKAIGIVNES